VHPHQSLRASCPSQLSLWSGTCNEWFWWRCRFNTLLSLCWDAAHFHSTLNRLVITIISDYPVFKRWCDSILSSNIAQKYEAWAGSFFDKTVRSGVSRSASRQPPYIKPTLALQRRAVRRCLRFRAWLWRGILPTMRLSSDATWSMAIAGETFNIAEGVTLNSTWFYDRGTIFGQTNGRTDRFWCH